MRSRFLGPWLWWILLGACSDSTETSTEADRGADPSADQDADQGVDERDEAPHSGEHTPSARIKNLDADAGRWREGRPAARLTREQRAEIKRLEAIGYLAGSAAARRLAGVTIFDTARSHPGLNLVVSGHQPQADLIAMDGRKLHSWKLDYEEAFPEEQIGDRGVRRHMWRRARLLPGGDLLAIYEGAGLVRIDRDSALRWAYTDDAHHDLDMDEQGRIHILTRTPHIVPRFNEERPILEDFLVILDPEGQELERVSVLECFEGSEFSHHLDQVRAEGGDILHTNTLEYLDGRHEALSPVFARGNVLISIRRLDLLAIIDFDAEEVVWARTGTWRVQHQPVLLGDGNMLLFDNNREGLRRSAVIEFEPLTGKVLWTYKEREPDVFFSKSCGSCQRLANGNTLVTESDYGRAFELSPEQDIVWEYHNPYRAGDKNELVATLFDVVRFNPEEVQSWLEVE